MINVKKTKRKDLHGEEQKYYGYVSSNGQITIDEIVERINARCTVTKSDIVAVLAAFQEQSIYALRNGQRVSLGSLGSLYPRVSSEIVAEAKDLTADSIRSLSVGFRAGKQLAKRVQPGNRDVKIRVQ